MDKIKLYGEKVIVGPDAILQEYRKSTYQYGEEIMYEWGEEVRKGYVVKEYDQTDEYIRDTVKMRVLVAKNKKIEHEDKPKYYILSEGLPTNSGDLINRYVFTDKEEAIEKFNDLLEENDFDGEDEECQINEKGQLNEWSYCSNNCKCIRQASILSELVLTLEETK